MFPCINSMYTLHKENLMPHLKERLSKWFVCFATILVEISYNKDQMRIEIFVQLPIYLSLYLRICPSTRLLV